MRSPVLILALAMGICFAFASPQSVHAAPANDNFAAALPVGALPSTANVETSQATLEAGEPQLCGVGSKTVWFTFIAPSSGLYEVDTYASTFDTVLAIYTGASMNSLTNIDCIDDVPSGKQSRIQLQATAGVAYKIQVGGYGEAAGALALHVYVTPPSPANDNYAAALSVGELPYTGSQETARATTEQGEPATSCFEVGKTVWYEFTPPASGTYQIDTLGSDVDTVLAVYTGSSLAGLVEMACSDDVSVSVVQSSLTLSLAGGTSYRIQAGGVSFNRFGLSFTDYGRLFLNVTASSPDTDGDGCSDAQESGSDPTLGGERDPLLVWDFYDVPAPTGPLAPDGKPLLSTSSERNEAVTLQDVAVVLAYVGRDAGDAAYAQDNNGDGTADGAQLDRTPSTDVSEPWHSGAPSGGITLQDVGVALAQVGHHCTTAIPTEDSDGDGCFDAQEQGADPALGGDRNPWSAWDFYDVPAPVGLDTGADGKPLLSTASARNGSVSLQDTGVVLSYVGRSSSNPAYTQDNNDDGRADGEQLDRTPSDDPSRPWRSRAPNGGITLQDVGVSLAQVGHTCPVSP